MDGNDHIVLLLRLRNATRRRSVCQSTHLELRAAGLVRGWLRYSLTRDGQRLLADLERMFGPIEADFLGDGR